MDMQCTICSQHLLTAAVSTEQRREIEQFLEIQMPENSQICYICYHMLLKLQHFKNMCIRKYSLLQEYCMRSNRHTNEPRYKLHFCVTKTSVHHICPLSECNIDKKKYYETSHCGMDGLCDNDADSDYGHFTEITSHSIVKPSDDDPPDDIHEYKNESVFSCNDREEAEENSYMNEENITSECGTASSDHLNTSSLNNVEQNDDLETQDDAAEPAEDGAEEDKPYFMKTLLSMEEQKGELEALRREKKYSEATFKCYNCALGFTLKDSYQSHMVRHEESNGEFSCGVCGLRFASAGVRSMHAAQHAERHTCSRCGRAVRRPRRRHHAARCWRDERTPCHLCGKLFGDTASLQQHLRRLHAERPRRKSYACGVCGNTYRDASGLRVHTITHGNRRFNCTKCSSTFSTPYSLSRHAATHGTAQPAYCAPCDAWFRCRKTYRAHVRTAAAHRTESHECPRCGLACATKQSLAAHAAARHGDGAEHACAVCPARYTTRRSLLRHARAHAGVVAPVAVCHLCGKSYKGRNKLNRHLRDVCEPKYAEDIAD